MRSGPLDGLVRGAPALRKAAAAGALALAVLCSARAEAAALRYQVDQKGDFVVVGNTLGFDCGPGVPAPLVGTVGACGSSTSDTAPECFGVRTRPCRQRRRPSLSAWRAPAARRSSRFDRRHHHLRAPLLGGRAGHRRYLGAGRADRQRRVFLPTVNADASATATATGASPHTYYQSTADVTALVQARGVGQYRLSGVDTASFNNQNDDVLFAGWSMIVLSVLPSARPQPHHLRWARPHQLEWPVGDGDLVGFSGAERGVRRQARCHHLRRRRPAHRRLAVVQRGGAVERAQPGQ